MESEQPRTSNSSRESGSEFANSVSSASGSIAGKLSLANANNGNETVDPVPESVSMEDRNEGANSTTPACAQPTDVVKLAESTLQNLKVLWEEIGFAEHECDNATAEMFAEVKRVFENKLSTTQDIKCQLTSQIRLANARICTIGTELGESASVESFRSNEDSSAPSLRGVLAASKAFLDDLEGRKAERVGVLTHKTGELGALLQELEGALSADQTKFLKVVSDLTLGRIEQLDARIAEQEQHKLERQAAVGGLVEEIRGLWGELHMAAEAFTAGSVDARIQAGEEWRLTGAGVAELEAHVQQLRDERERRSAAKAKAMEELQGLWDITKAESEAAQAFAAAHNTVSTQCLDAIRAEIVRLQAVKQAMMKELVLEKRAALAEVWEAMRLPEEKRTQAAAELAEEYTEASLHAHEEAVRGAQQLLSDMQPLLKIVDRRLLIRAEEAAMKEQQGDPSRLLGRGRGMAERLKQEERVRNMVTKELPKLNEKLKALITEFKETHGRDFEVDGVVYEEVLRDDLEAAAASAKARKAGGKAGAPPPSSTKAPPQTPRDGKDEGGGRPAGGAAPGSTATKFRSTAKAISRVPMASLDTNNVGSKRHAEGEADDGSSTARSAAKSPKNSVQQTAAGRGVGHGARPLKRTITPKQ